MTRAGLTPCAGSGEQYTPTRVRRCPTCARPRSAIGEPLPDGTIPVHVPDPAGDRPTARRR